MAEYDRGLGGMLVSGGDPLLETRSHDSRGLGGDYLNDAWLLSNKRGQGLAWKLLAANEPSSSQGDDPTNPTQ